MNLQFAILSTSLLAAPIILYFVKKQSHALAIQKLRKRYDADAYQYKTVFVSRLTPDSCQQHLYKRRPCGADCAHEKLKKIINFIKSAKSSISICMYHLTIEDIAEAIITCSKQNIKVRCITDKVMANAGSSKFRPFAAAGIPVKIPSQNVGLMHHKAIIIDGDLPKCGKVLSGSLNMTVQGLTHNWDHFVITNNRDIVGRFYEEFEHLWENLQPFS